MSQYEKLFDRAEIEYITPFLNLWMSFNNWFRKDIGMRTSDTKAIDRCKKEESPVNKKFKRLLEGSSAESKQFQDALHFFIQGNETSYLAQNRGEEKSIYKNPAPEEQDKEDLSFISSTHQTYFYDKFHINGIIAKTLDNIYQVRCALVHGSFDIEDKNFQELVENSYKILYPIMGAILREEKAAALDAERAALKAGMEIIDESISDKEEK